MKLHQTLLSALLLLFASTTRAVDHQAWTAGAFQLTGPGSVCDLDFGSHVQFNSDANIVIFRNADPSRIFWDSAQTSPDCNGRCLMVFQADGNLVVYNGNGRPLWNSETYGRGVTMACLDQDPYLMIFDAKGWLIWHAPSKTPTYTLSVDCPYLKTAPWYCI